MAKYADDVVLDAAAITLGGVLIASTITAFMLCVNQAS